MLDRGYARPDDARQSGTRIQRALVIQTAFAGDLILSLPLISELRRVRPDLVVDVLCIPSTAPLLAGHPDVDTVIPYDKRGGASLLAQLRRVRSRDYAVCLSPHRSMRSALLARATGAPVRVAFDTSAARWCFTRIIPYRPDVHEIVRVLSLLEALDPESIDYDRRPSLHPSVDDERIAREVLAGISEQSGYICLAPGSVWATKRWTEEGFISIGRELGKDQAIVVIGGAEDRALGERIAAGIGGGCISICGRTSLRVSAAIVRDARLVISNDSAPVHLASAMGTPVVEIFGATVPAFGFTPFGVPHRIVEIGPLPCRPCGIHGGTRCPIGSFDCMRTLPPERVLSAARELLTPRVSGF